MSPGLRWWGRSSLVAALCSGKKIRVESAYAQVDFGSAHLPVLRVSYGTLFALPTSWVAARDARTCDKTSFRHPILTTALWY
eukprot:2686629-Prymnesium_polylepis.1